MSKKLRVFRGSLIDNQARENMSVNSIDYDFKSYEVTETLLVIHQENGELYIPLMRIDLFREVKEGK